MSTPSNSPLTLSQSMDSVHTCTEEEVSFLTFNVFICHAADSYVRNLKFRIDKTFGIPFLYRANTNIHFFLINFKTSVRRILKKFSILKMRR